MHRVRFLTFSLIAVVFLQFLTACAAWQPLVGAMDALHTRAMQTGAAERFQPGVDRATVLLAYKVGPTYLYRDGEAVYLNLLCVQSDRLDCAFIHREDSEIYSTTRALSRSGPHQNMGRALAYHLLRAGSAKSLEKAKSMLIRCGRTGNNLICRVSWGRGWHPLLIL